MIDTTREENHQEALLAASKAGEFLQAVHRILVTDRGERDELSKDLAALHNAGLVDVIGEFEKLDKDSSSGPDFFLRLYVFEKTLPALNAPVAPVLHCVLQLYRRAGQDAAAVTILNAFIEFCAKQPARARDALADIEAQPDNLMDLLPATIAAGSQSDNPHYLAEVIRLSAHSNTAFRRRAVVSMSRIQWPKGENVSDVALDSLERSAVEESDDEILAHVIESAFALCQQDETKEARVSAIISKALEKGGEHALHAASTLFGYYTKDLPDPLLDLLLNHLKQVKAENRGTLGNIDHGISHLLEGIDSEKALEFMEELLSVQEDKLKIKAFAGALGAVRESSALISKVMTRWFLRGQGALCESVREIGDSPLGNDLIIEVDPTELKRADGVHIIFLARKAIGYFFPKPVTAASIVISLMHHAPDDGALEELGELLLNPLLLNYTGNMRDYVQKRAQSESGKVQETIKRALASIDEYLKALPGVRSLAALHPAMSQREAYRRRTSESIAESRKAAEKQSVLFGLFARSTLLYGRKSINYIHAGDGPPRRLETPLTSHSVEMEIPRMEILDSFGLKYMLLRFRAEQFKT